MGRDTNPSCKRCRRSGVKLFLKGARCESAKCAIEKRNFPPGIRAVRPRKISEYGKRLREKQKLRFFYGVSEASIRKYFHKAATQKGITGDNLLQLFERRMDNVVYRAGLADSRKEARQLVKHGHFNLNGHKADIPSIQVKVGDQIEIRQPGSVVFKLKLGTIQEKKAPAWLNFDESKKAIELKDLPVREDIDVPVEEQLIVEFYSQ